MQEFVAPSLVPADPAASVADLLADRARATPDTALFALPQGDGWRDLTAAEFERAVVALAKGFVAAGIEPGTRIGLLSATRYEWTLIDFAAWYAGAAVVPVYETSSPDQVSWILSDADVCAAIVETPEHFTRVDEVRPDLPALREVWQIDLGDLDKLVVRGAEVPDAEIERRRHLARADDTATIIYTAGTTGRPKGCELTHANFVQLAKNAALAIPEVVHPEASTLLFITAAHVFARFIAVLAVHGGVRVGHQSDTSRLLPALASFRPTFLLAVPRVFEKVYNSAEQKAESGGKGAIFRWAAETGVAYSEASDSGHVPVTLKARQAVAELLVFRTLRRALGGRVRWAVSGSAPLGHRLGHFYRALGVTILEGYGLTETTAPVSVNRPSKNKIGTVGPVLPGVSVRVADDGEVETRGVNVFARYRHNDRATAEAFVDGWFRTGDLGRLDEDGYLTITGRKKEIIVTAGGKNVAPAELEDPIRANPIVSQVVVVGEGRPFIGALITLDTDMLGSWLKNHGEDATLAPERAAQLPAVRDELQRAVDAANTKVSRAESIRAFQVLPDDFTEANGELTPKLSIKRAVILAQRTDAVDRLYTDAKAHREASAAH
ncbi:AMP-dependent synthetase/ligase [uncultured Amnibacterium sp.]|uniref:AMP-dependent synthetase/ligase n=1 Tax=uncultured Amnibacterium sp. TaxID=1631851 RepID=UPI0035CC7F00